VKTTTKQRAAIEALQHAFIVCESVGVATSKELREFRALVRRAVADYMRSEGCSCCRSDSHDDHSAALARLLGVPKYDDDSGYDFGKYETPR